jgi:hypothetical protein
MVFSKFDRYVDRHSSALTERLQALCRMPSVAARGTGMRAIAEAVEQSMQRVGIGTRTFKMGSGYPIIYGECGSGPKSFVVYGPFRMESFMLVAPPTVKRISWLVLLPWKRIKRHLGSCLCRCGSS